MGREGGEDPSVGPTCRGLQPNAADLYALNERLPVDILRGYHSSCDHAGLAINSSKKRPG